MHSYNRQWLEDYVENGVGDLNPTQREKRKKHLDSLWSRHEKAADEVQKVAVIGAFMVSDAVADDLMRLRKAQDAAMAEMWADSEHGVDPYGAAAKEIKAIEDCIARVREHAKKDLGITRKWPSIMKRRGRVSPESAAT